MLNFLRNCFKLKSNDIERQRQNVYESPNDPQNAIDLEKILQENSDITLVKTLSQTLSAQGWAFVRVPDHLDNAAKEALKSLREYFYKSNYDEKISHFSAPQYGYQTSKYKEAMTVLSGDMILKDEKAVEKLLPKQFQVQESFINLAKILDEICELLLRKYGKELYGFDFNDVQQPSIVPLIQHANSSEKKYGMLDCVRYFSKYEIPSNNAKKAEQSEVEEHIDPGLFSISLISDAAGLELKDANGQWVPVPIDIPQLGVIWNGLLATQIGQSSNNQNKGGWHRVRGVHPNLSRMTIWYEVCASSQVSEPVQKEGMLALKEQNQQYISNQLSQANSKNGQQTLRIIHQNGRSVDINVDLQKDTVGMIKLQFEDKMGMRMSKSPMYMGDLKFKGKNIDDSRKLNYYGVKDGDQLELQIERY